jgi:iron complex outermembrane recepter protein
MKNQRALLTRAIRVACAAALGLSSSLSATSAFGQEAAGKDLEEIYVTGSRIARGSDFENPSPVVSFNKEELEKTGYTSLQQLLEKQPFAGTGTFSTRGNNQDSTANGSAAISLRGLGADATLVLVNGRRVQVSPFAESVTTSFVDINAIPVAAIERLEVLKDGASAVYGSDAVAGVVNVVLRKDYEGAELSASYGSTTESGLDETRLSGIWGVNGDDSNITVILDYFKNSTLKNVERGNMGSADQSSRGGIDARSSRSFPGSFVVDGVSTVDPACPPDRAAPPNCFYDYGPWNLLTPESERSGLMLMGRQGMGDDIEFFTEIGVQHNNGIAQGAPTPLDGEALLTVPTTHPNNPFPGATSIDIRRLRTVDAGPRAFDLTTDNLRLVLGLRGKINDFDWEVSGQRARAKSEQTGSRSQGWVRTDFLQQQINLGLYNPFGATFNSPDVINSITTSLVRRGTSDLTAYEGLISGDLFDIASGTVRMAAGVEYREESVEDVPDDQFQRGLIFGTESVAAQGSRDITSAYVEFSVPVLESLELSLAGRYDDYSDFGDTTNPKVALRWSPIESLAIRTSWGTGFRAPSLAQIGLGPSKESSFFVDAPLCAQEGPGSDACTLLDFTTTYTGNPDLDAEESESFNFGVGWRPTDAMEFSIDYWDITQDDKIDKQLPGPIVANLCTTQTSTACQRLAPLPGDALGELVTVFATFENAGKQSVNGIDLSAHYNMDLGPGALNLALDYSHLLEFTRALPSADGTTFVERDVVGKYEYPEDRFVLTGDWQAEAWGLNAVVNYIGSFDDLNGSPDYFDSTRTVDAFVTLNLQARYTGFKGFTLVLGAENALDEEPPFAIGDADTDVYGYVSGMHDPRGRFVYGRMTYNFE